MSKQHEETLSGRTKAFNSSFYPYSIKQWCALSEEIRNIVSVNKFKETIISFIRRKENSVFAIHDTNGLKLLTRLRLNFSHLNENKFRHDFKDPMIQCVNAVLKQKQHFTFSCVAGCILILEQNSWTIYILLIHLLTNYPDEKFLKHPLVWIRIF